MARGADLIAAALAAGGCQAVFAYPGTSELSLCEAIDGQKGLRLVNARGDKEAVFAAGGANGLRPGSAVAILHGARGLTNALGAIGDLRRSEIPALVLVGMPSRASAPFSPPHGEPRLLEGAALFARAAFEVRDDHPEGPQGLVRQWRSAAAAALERPYGPVLLGLPQDLLQDELEGCTGLAGEVDASSVGPPQQLGRCASLLAGSTRPVILIDDFALAEEDASWRIGELATAIGAPVLQLDYRRGPMLFERLTPERAPTFVGMYDPLEPVHRRMLQEADLLITIEDRNMYPRVVGDLPPCPKIALTSNPAVTGKNGYLQDGDPVLAGSVSELVAVVLSVAGSDRDATAPSTVDLSVRRGATCSASATALADALGRPLGRLARRLVVDDSQMFGGLLGKHYGAIAPDRVFGSHGGFVGSGLAKAAGLAAVAEAPVICTVGDQGFVNGIQALAVIGECDLPVLIVLCNNGESVSLRKQSRSDGLERMGGQSPFLANGSNIDYGSVARGFGITGRIVEWSDRVDVAAAESAIAAAVELASTSGRPLLLELRTPSAPEFWAGVWAVSGVDDVSGLVDPACPTAPLVPVPPEHVAGRA